MAAVMNFQAPHRKPVPAHPAAAPYMQAQQPPHAYSSSGMAMRNASPSYAAPAQQQQQQPQQYQQQYPTRRTLSNATSSTSSTSNNAAQVRQAGPASTYASSICRSTSSRSTSTTSPTSYVALMRKQKATVWCDRAQHEDPRILAAQRQAKMRATQEVAGAHHHTSNGGRSSTSSSGIAGGVRSKIRGHHGAPKASTYNAANLSGAGVPMRLSATEVDEGDSGEEDNPANRLHQRNDSSRSSASSANRQQTQPSHTMSMLSRPYPGGLPPASQTSTSASSPTFTADSYSPSEDLQTPMPQTQQQSDYFVQSGGSGGSGSSGEAERGFGAVSGLPVTTRSRGNTAVRKTSDELRRRGSVDDRTMTMSAGRLFVANPDLSD